MTKNAIGMTNHGEQNLFHVVLHIVRSRELYVGVSMTYVLRTRIHLVMIQNQGPTHNGPLRLANNEGKMFASIILL